MSSTRIQRSGPESLESAGSAIPWHDLIATVYHHRRTVTWIFSIGIVISTLWSWITPPVYRASALLMVKDQRAQMAVTPDARSHNIGDAEQEDEVNSLATLAYQATLIESVLKKLSQGQDTTSTESETNWVVWFQDSVTSFRYWVLSIPEEFYRRLHGVPPPTEMESRVMRLQKDLQFTPLPGSNLVEIAYVSRSPRWAAKVVNGLTGELIKTYTRLYESEDTHRFYQNQRNLLSDTLSKAETELVAFRERVGSDLLSLDITDLQTRIANLELELVEVQGRRAELEAQTNVPDEAIVADASSQDTESGTVGNPAISSLKTRLMELQIERSQLLSRYTPTSAAVRDIDRQIAEARRILAQERAITVDMYRKTARAKIDGNDARVAAVNAQLAKYRNTLERLERVLPEWNRLQNDAQTQKEAYLNYLRKEEEARVSSALDESQIVNIAIAERAQVPTEPQGGRVKRRILFGAILSALLAFGVAFIRDWMDPSVKTASQAERLVGLPVLGELQG